MKINKDLIPKNTVYCYEFDKNTKKMKVCPYWEMLDEVDEYNENICYCKYLKCKSYVQDAGNLIWDMCKECGISEVGEDER